jgi:DNA-binding transcriptional ArsR family regulator
LLSCSSSTVVTRQIDCALLFAALGDTTRLRLVSRLCNDGPMCITSLATDTNITRQAVTKHLKVLEEAGLLHSSRKGRESIWQLDRERVEEAQHYLGMISTQWGDALTRLRSFVEE